MLSDSEWPAFPVVARTTFLTFRIFSISAAIGSMAILINAIGKDPLHNNATIYAALVPNCLAIGVGTITLFVYCAGQSLNPLWSTICDAVIAVTLIICNILPLIKVKQDQLTCDGFIRQRFYDACALFSLSLALACAATLFSLVTAAAALRVYLRQRAYLKAKATRDRAAVQQEENKFNATVMNGTGPEVNLNAA